MALAIGTRLGPYEIVAPLGSGGMGDVYRGLDTRFNRDVAIKVLPASVADNPTRRARFEREARAISRLNHPNICAIYDAGEHDGVPFIVMPYIDGETLEHRLRAGALPWPDALRIGVQIASAIQSAHDHGIVHRDLKPANVMQSGSAIKLLDFGIAKLIQDDHADPHAETISITADHKVVGTLNYMAPEQHEGGPIDGRADVFALGSVLYEVLTGRRAFDGASAASVTAAVMRADPLPISPTPTTGARAVPAALDHVVRRALAKQPDDRWQTARDFEHELQWIAENPRHEPVPSRSSAFRRHRVLPALAGALVLATGGWTGWKVSGPRPASPGSTEITSFTIDAPAGTVLGPGMGRIAVSPDGSKIAFAAMTKGRPSIWLYDLSSAESRRLEATDNGRDPFWSPDGLSLGFYADGETVIKRVDLAGGPAREVARVPREDPIGHELAAAWMADDSIVYSLKDGLHRVPAKGGTDSLFIKSDGLRLGLPVPIDANMLLYRATYQPQRESRVGGTSGTETILPDVKSNAVLVPGYLMFHDGTRLVVQRFDASRHELSGQPLEITSDVDLNPLNFRASFSASADVLAYAPQLPLALHSIDRTGRRIGTVGELDRDSQVALPRDHSNRMAVTRVDPTRPLLGQVVVIDQRGRETLLTHEPSSCPVWSPDGRWIAYATPAPSGQGSDIHRASSPPGAGADELIAHIEGEALPLDWSSDGRYIVYSHASEVWAVSVADKKQHQLTTTGAADRAARLSNDGHWLAYRVRGPSGDSLWVQAFPEGSVPTQVPGKGFDPAWSADGRELYYMTLDGTLMAVPMSVSAARLPVFGAPVPLFDISATAMTRALHVFTVAPDGTFVVREPSRQTGGINVIVNWAARFRQ